MSIFSALYTGASGVTAMGDSIQVIGNNIANVNTVGYKTSRTEFSDLFSQAITTSSGRNQIGRGVQVEAIQQLFHQGSFQNSSIVTDVAINGTGFFRLHHPDNNQIFYSRAGQFRIDNEGFLTNSLGLYVQGYAFDANGQIGNRTPERIDLNNSMTAAPNPTGNGVAEGSGVFLNANLNAESEVNPGGAAFDINDPNGTSNFTTSVTVFDSLGLPHTVISYFRRVGVYSPGDPLAAPPVPATNNDWEWHAAVDGSELTNGTTGLTEVGSGTTLSFDANGQLTGATDTQLSFNFAGAAQGQTIGFDFAGSTQVGNETSTTNTITQDGYGAGTLQSIDVSQDGVITGFFSNGVTRNLSQFVLASFPAETELNRVGNSLFQMTPESGQEVLGYANAGGNGTVSGNSLEMSNVDLADEFVTLINTQRAFQANTKIITTADQMLETIIGIKR